MVEISLQPCAFIAQFLIALQFMQDAAARMPRYKVSGKASADSRPIDSFKLTKNLQRLVKPLRLAQNARQSQERPSPQRRAVTAGQRSELLDCRVVTLTEFVIL